MTEVVALQPTERPRRGPGRPRHADTEPRAYRAALELFGRRGWSGFTLDGVASQAGIGKSSIYLRWSDKSALLLDALRDLQTRVPLPQTDGLGIRDQLVAHARARAELLLGEYGPTMASLCTAAAANPEELRQLRQVDLARGVCALAPQVEDAVAAGELPSGTAVRPLLEAIEGAILVHILVAPTQTVAEMRADLDRYICELVDTQLRALRP